MKTTLVGRLLILSIACLIVLLPLWYWAAPWFAAPPIWLAGSAMKTFFSWAQSWEQHGVDATLNTLVQVRVSGAQGDALGDLSPDVAYPTYGYGLVLLWALFIATRLTTRAPWWLPKALLGSVLLIPVQAWGLCFQWLRDVVLLSGPAGQAYLGYSSWANNAIAFGYQLGFLMFPAVTPILLWLLFNKRFVAALWLEATLSGTMRPEMLKRDPTFEAHKRRQRA